MRVVILNVFIVQLMLGLASCGTMPTERSPGVNGYLKAFLDVHGWYCDRPQSDVAALRLKLKSDPRLAPAAGYDDIYETIINGVSYAISPGDDSCTTDVLLVQKGSEKVIITLNEMDLLLKSRGYREIAEKESIDEGLNGDSVAITIKGYQTPANERAVLTYPVDNPANYYMTLWVEKFNE